MNYHKMQEKEIATIKERNIQIRLSDADCKRISEHAGKAGMTIGQLLSSFVGDLIDGTYTNGSDEVMLARKWFVRCGFDTYADHTLLKYLLDRYEDIEDFLDLYDDMQYSIEHSEEYVNERAAAKANGEDMLWFEREYHMIADDFLQKYPACNMEKETELCRKWLQEYQSMTEEPSSDAVSNEQDSPDFDCDDFMPLTNEAADFCQGLLEERQQAKIVQRLRL